METDFSYIDENYKKIAYNVQEAFAKYRNSNEHIDIMAVTKTVDPQAVNHAIGLGIGLLGENRVQEYMAKKEFYSKNTDVHFIGHLQTNKVKYIIGKVDMIQSVDRLALAQEIDRLAARAGVVQDVMIEVNIGGEAQKGGIGPDELPGFLEMISAMNGIRVRGLMCIPPAVGEDGARPYFAKMRALFETLGSNQLPNVSMEQLSMGMSGDYMAAIAEGATMIRVGTALFGARQYAAART